MRWNEIDQHVRRVLIFVHEWSSTTSSLWEIKRKRQTFISFIVMKYLVCKPLLFKLPLMQISKVITLQIVKAFCSCAALANSLIYFSSVEFTRGSFYRNRCLRRVCWIITAIVSSVLIRFDWSWLRIVARSFFFLLLSWISTSCHRVQPALPQPEKSITTGGEPVM